MEKIKVFLSDPQILFREGIHFILSGEEEFDVIGEATGNEEALAAIESNPPAVAILNLQKGKLDGLEATRRIKRNLPSVSVILVTEGENEEQLFGTVRSGASACLTKDVDPDMLVSLIKEVVKGSQPIVQCLLKPALAAKSLAEFEALSALGEPLSAMMARLSPKEADLLKRIAEGNTIEQVGVKLTTSEDMIRNQLKLIVQKLIANDRDLVLIQAVQGSLSRLLSGTIQRKPATEYVTKDDFAKFKETFLERFKSVIVEQNWSSK
ncbi:MAG: response regulator transcription factor [Dehalococcoidales bacterium]|nr:response regulator transcription factor [Dehalococcoidales bacterium]